MGAPEPPNQLATRKTSVNEGDLSREWFPHLSRPGGRFSERELARRSHGLGRPISSPAASKDSQDGLGASMPNTRRRTPSRTRAP